MKSKLVLFAAIFASSLLIFTSSCSEDPIETVDEPPVACHEVEIIPDRCGASLTLVYDASCSTDDRTSLEELEVRWDLKGDGFFTDFFPVTEQITQSSFLRPGIRHLLYTRAEVRDSAGHIERSYRFLDLEPYLLSGPDLFAWYVYFHPEGSGADVTQVEAGDEFTFGVSYTCWVEGDYDRDFVIDWYRDGELIHSVTSHCTSLSPPSSSLCQGTGKAWVILTEPGEYEYTAVLRSPPGVEELSLENNTVSATLTVVPASE